MRDDHATHWTHQNIYFCSLGHTVGLCLSLTALARFALEPYGLLGSCARASFCLIVVLNSILIQKWLFHLQPRRAPHHQHQRAVLSTITTCRACVSLSVELLLCTIKKYYTAIAECLSICGKANKLIDLSKDITGADKWQLVKIIVIIIIILILVII